MAVFVCLLTSNDVSHYTQQSLLYQEYACTHAHALSHTDLLIKVKKYLRQP